MSVLSIGNIHVAVVDKTIDVSNRTQPICLIPLKTVKEDLTYLSGSVNSQMLLDNLSGESIYELAVDHLMTVLEKLKTTPPVNLKVVFSSVTASTPLLQDDHDQSGTDSQEILLDETTHLAESPSFEVTTEDVIPSALEIALLQVLDKEIQFSSNDALESLDKEEQYPEMTNQFSAGSDLLVGADFLAAEAKLGISDNRKNQCHFQIHTSNHQQMSEDAARPASLESQFTELNHSQTHASNLHPIAKHALISDTLVRQIIDPYHSQIHPNDLRPISTDAARLKNLESLFGDLNYPQTHPSDLQPMSKDASGLKSLGIPYSDPNHSQTRSSNLQLMSKDQTGSGTWIRQLRDPIHSHVRSSPLDQNAVTLPKNCKQEEMCLSPQGRIDENCEKSNSNCIVISQDTEPGTRRVSEKFPEEGTMKVDELEQSSHTFRRTFCETISSPDLLPPELSFGQVFSSDKTPEILTANVIGIAEVHTDNNSSQTVKKKPFDINQVDNSPDISTENRSLTECNTFVNVNDFQPLSVASISQINSPGVQTFTKLKVATDDTMSVASGTVKKLGKNTAKTIKGGERCRCLKCGHNSIRYVNLLNHTIQCHMRTVPCICADCGEEIRSPVAFQYHQLIHTEVTQKDKDTLNRLAFTVRKKEIDSEKNYPCKTCGRSFISKRRLEIHLTIHSGEKPFQCEICGSRFLSNGALNAHVKTHSGEKRFPCTLCHKTFTKNISLKQHTLSHTAEKVYRCLICPLKFPTKDLLAEHMSGHQARGKSIPVCEICKKTFSTKSHLQRHVVIHSGERPYRCDICGRSFAQRSNLTAHRRLHAREKDCVCCRCGEQFMSSCRRKQQMYMCNACKTSPD